MPQIDINGYRMHYTDLGRGTAIIFIHPPVLTSLNFQCQIRELSMKFRSVAFDIRGHGKSGPSGKEVTYPLIVEDIKQLMDRLEIKKAFLCGYSTGGSVVLEFLLTYPERGSGGIVVGGMSEVNERKLKRKILNGRFLSKIGAVGFIAFVVSWGQSKKPLLMRSIFKDAKKTNPKNAEQYYEYSLHYNCTEQLGNIHQPVLLVYGEKDKLFLPYANLLHERLPKSELVFVENTKHQIPTKAADDLNGLIQGFIHRYSSMERLST